MKTIKVLSLNQEVVLGKDEDGDDVIGVIHSVQIFNDYSIQYSLYVWDGVERIFGVYTPADIHEGLEARYVQVEMEDK